MESGKKGPFKETVESLFAAIAIALIIRAGVVYPFKIPTESMDGTLLKGDHIICNKFVYGIRTPDWVGIPYTDLGFYIPHARLPGFRDPSSGDVVIFKYPRDRSEYYIKRCVAVSGDTLEIRDRVTYINGKPFQGSVHEKYELNRILPRSYRQTDLFPPGQCNIHQYGPIRIPAPGDTYVFSEANRESWFEWLHLMLYEGQKLTVTWEWKTHAMTVENIQAWPQTLGQLPLNAFQVNGQPLTGHEYRVKDRQYFVMGDNRDNSADSRYWGFLPERYIVGEALIKYWSWDSDKPLYRLTEKVRWNRLLGLIY